MFLDAQIDLADEVMADEPDYWRACADGDEAVAKLRDISPGPELAAALAEANSMLMSSGSQMVLYAAWERQRSWTEAQQMICARQLLPQDAGETDAYVAAELGLHAGLSEHSMQTRLGTVRCIGAGLPMTWEALNAGRITTMHAWLMTKVTAGATPELAQRVEAAVLEGAIHERLIPGKLAEAARAAMLGLDPEGAQQRAAKAKKHESDVFLAAEEDEMARVTTRTDAWTSRRMMDEINRRADDLKRAGDVRPIGQIRAEVAAEAVLGPLGPQLDAGDVLDDDAEDDEDAKLVAETNGRRVRTPKRATALLLISLETLLGGDQPGHLDGYGPITAQLARRIAAGDTRFRRLVLDPLSGRPIDLGTTSYKLSPEMRRWLEARDRTCRFPSCERRAVFCDSDHGVEFPEGETSCANCGLLCRRHHNWKTRKDWDLVREDDDVVWTSPNGLRYRRKAATYKDFIPWPEEPPPDDLGLDDIVSAGFIPADPTPPDPDAPWPDTDPTLTIPAPLCYCEEQYDEERLYALPDVELARAI